MKTIKALILLTVVIAASSCQTKQEAARDNISKTWKIQSVTRDGADDTANYLQNRSDYTITFNQEGAFRESYVSFGSSTPVVVNGSYTINASVTQLSLESDFQSRPYNIDLLEEGNLNLTDQGSSDEVKVFHVPD